VIFVKAACCSRDDINTRCREISRNFLEVTKSSIKMVGCGQEEYTLLRNVHYLWATRDGLVINTMGQKSGHPHNLPS